MVVSGVWVSAGVRGGRGRSEWEVGVDCWQKAIDDEHVKMAGLRKGDFHLQFQFLDVVCMPQQSLQ